MHSEESGFNEDDVEASEAEANLDEESETSSDKTHLLYTRDRGKRASFTEYCSVDTNYDKSAN